MSGKPKSGLGRGFDSLIPQNFDDSILLDEGERVQKIHLDKLVANKDQPRQEFDDKAMAELANSVKQHGILQPLVVTPADGNTYRIVAGERRWRAAKLAKLDHVPVIVRSLKQLEELEIALVENMQRVDLSPLETAVSIERLVQQFNMTYEQVGNQLGKNQSTVNNIVRLLQLPLAAKQALADRKITEGHARAILALKNTPELQQRLLDSIIKNGWSVRQAERFVTSVKDGVKSEKETEQRVSTETPETKQLSQQLATPVQIRRTAKGGKLEITFKNEAELARIIAVLRD